MIMGAFRDTSLESLIGVGVFLAVVLGPLLR